tara:strand:- start:18405 stop:19736 length:1332 start_codon:yes stop_codon:yes gene_type:complete
MKPDKIERKNKSLELWNRAIEIIPGGNGLLSKRPDRYAPDIWPAYFQKAKGVYIWDIEGNRYVDMAQMGLGTAILGYSDDNVNKAVCDAIERGINTTLNCPEEVALAEKILQFDSCFEGVKFARTGGEAMSIAIRIARAFSGKDKIAFSGYHGWSDWYLATNLESKENLKDHLLPGLSPLGVPAGLKGTSIPFKYNDVEDVIAQTKDHELAAIVIEGARYEFATEGFLKEVRRIANEKNAILIFDEITSGFRMCMGGVYHLYDIQPDMAVYGKALGNGFAISAIAGKKDVMDSAQDTFISSTFWTERVGFAAALETINQLEKRDVFSKLSSRGRAIASEWQKLFKKHNLDFAITEFLPLVTFKPMYKENNNKILTLFSQEMLEKGYLASSSIYLSDCHTEGIIEDYMKALDSTLETVASAIESKSIDKYLKTRIREDGFKRLT